VIAEGNGIPKQPPLYLSTVRGMNIKEIALFAWLPFLAADIGAFSVAISAPSSWKTSRCRC